MAENGHAIIYLGRNFVKPKTGCEAHSAAGLADASQFAEIRIRLIAWVYDVLRGDFADLDGQSYHCHSRIEVTELAIVIAASIANWMTEKGQSIELYTNGEESWIPDGRV